MIQLTVSWFKRRRSSLQIYFFYVPGTPADSYFSTILLATWSTSRNFGVTLTTIFGHFLFCSVHGGLSTTPSHFWSCLAGADPGFSERALLYWAEREREMSLVQGVWTLEVTFPRKFWKEDCKLQDFFPERLIARLKGNKVTTKVNYMHAFEIKERGEEYTTPSTPP